MKNNKGFTLVELLSVIIILSIIAVITVPKISKTMNDTRSTIAEDNAYAYIKAVDKYYLQKTMNKEEILLEGQYEVNAEGLLYTNTESHKIEIEGRPPLNGQLTYENNELKNGCLTIDTYKVTITNGKISKTEKGSCK